MVDTSPKPSSYMHTTSDQRLEMRMAGERSYHSQDLFWFCMYTIMYMLEYCLLNIHYENLHFYTILLLPLSDMYGPDAHLSKWLVMVHCNKYALECNVCWIYYTCNTVEPPNKGHFGSRAFVLFSEVVLWWEVRANVQFIAPSRPNIPR